MVSIAEGRRAASGSDRKARATLAALLCACACVGMLLTHYSVSEERQAVSLLSDMDGLEQAAYMNKEETEEFAKLMKEQVRLSRHTWHRLAAEALTKYPVAPSSLLPPPSSSPIPLLTLGLTLTLIIILFSSFILHSSALTHQESWHPTLALRHNLPPPSARRSNHICSTPLPPALRNQPFSSLWSRTMRMVSDSRRLP